MAVRRARPGRRTRPAAPALLERRRVGRTVDPVRHLSATGLTTLRRRPAATRPGTPGRRLVAPRHPAAIRRRTLTRAAAGFLGGHAVLRWPRAPVRGATRTRHANTSHRAVVPGPETLVSGAARTRPATTGRRTVLRGPHALVSGAARARRAAATVRSPLVGPRPETLQPVIAVVRRASAARPTGTTTATAPTPANTILIHRHAKAVVVQCASTTGGSRRAGATPAGKAVVQRGGGSRAA
ncbi:hypothetical protein RB614_41810, partial [Phytohabitans sp. ZYX-F-186]